MDEIIEKFEVAHVEPPNIPVNTNFEELYKNWGRLGNQEERRKEILQHQKDERNMNLDKFRGIFESLHDEQNTGATRHYRPSIYVAGFHRASFTYANVLMMSEWIIEKPKDFEQNWFIVPCPKGNRVLLVANRGRSVIYSKFGQFIFECCTALPGGNPYDRKCKQQCCVFDGFYQEKNNTFYILDVLAWNQQPMTNGEAEFRQYWMESNLLEFSALRCLTKKNEIIISLLPKISCAPDTLNQYLMKYPPFEGNFPQLDGFLFYHKKAHYFSGETPLVGWLFPFMIPEILGSDITIHNSYLATKPADYIDQAEYIKKFEAKRARKIIKPHRTNKSDSATKPTDKKKHKKSKKKPSEGKDEGADNNNSMEVQITDETVDEEPIQSSSKENNNKGGNTNEDLKIDEEPMKNDEATNDLQNEIAEKME